MALTQTQTIRKLFLKDMTPKLSLIGRVEYSPGFGDWGGENSHYKNSQR